MTEPIKTHGNCEWWQRWPKTRWGEHTLYGVCTEPELPLALPTGGYKGQLFEMDDATGCSCWKRREANDGK